MPGKALKEHNGFSPLDVLIKRIKKIAEVKKLSLQQQNSKKTIYFKNFKKTKVKLFRGKTNNVLDRYYSASKFYKSKNIIRLTSDCPFVETSVIKKLIKIFNTNKFDYVSNTYPLPCTYPDGSDIEIFSFDALKKLN